MYDNLTLYYLNQIGIIPWVNKHTYGINSNNDATQPKIIIAALHHQGSKGSELLKNICSCLFTSSNEYITITSVLGSNPSPNCPGSSKMFDWDNIKLFIVFGAVDSLPDIPESIPVLKLPCLKSLMINPQEKKGVYYQLIDSIRKAQHSK